MGHARALLALDQEEDILEARDQLLTKRLSVRETEALVKKIKAFGRPAKTGSKPAADPQLVHLAGELKRTLGTQVKIVPKGKGGKIEVSYFSAAELDRLLELFGIS
jgi:ParB family chromosome partitioning protein